MFLANRRRFLIVRRYFKYHHWNDITNPLAYFMAFYNIEPFVVSNELNWGENCIQHQSTLCWQAHRKVMLASKPSLVCYSTWHKIRQHNTKCRLRFALMSKYCCDLKWSFWVNSCNNTYSLSWIIFPAPCVNSALITSHHQTFAHVIILSIVAISRLT